MKIRKLKLLGLLLGTAVMFGSCTSGSQGAQEEAEIKDDVRIYPVKVQAVKTDTIQRTINYTANLEPFEEVYLAPASPGRIQKINVEVGDRISKGQVLVQMDRTQLQQAVIQMNNALDNFRRLDTLYQLGSIPEQQYEQVKSQYEVAMSNVEFLKENTTLVSPINGIITGKYFENGEVYSGAPNTAAGKAAILTLNQIKPLKAIVSVSESYYPDIRKGMPAVITTDIYPGDEFKGEVYRIYPTIDQATRTFRVEIKVNNPDEKLRPGMFARVNLETGTSAALVVPAISILREDGTNNRYVFLNNDGKAKKVEVKLGKRFDDRIEIISNEIRAGDKLIVAGQASLMQGVDLRVER